MDEVSRVEFLESRHVQILNSACGESPSRILSECSNYFGASASRRRAAFSHSPHASVICASDVSLDSGWRISNPAAVKDKHRQLLRWDSSDRLFANCQ